MPMEDIKEVTIVPKHPGLSSGLDQKVWMTFANFEMYNFSIDLENYYEDSDC